MQKGYLVYNGESSLDHGVYVSGNATYTSAEKDYDKVSIPGRNGDLLVFNGRYKNITVTYPCSIIPGNADYETTTAGIMEWLYKGDGYLRLEDTYHPDYYRAALFTGPLNFKTIQFKAGQFNLQFDCKPQKFLKQNSFATEEDCIAAGYTTDEQIWFYMHFIKEKSPESSLAGFGVSNPTAFESKPLIYVYGYGTITFDDESGNRNTVVIANYKADHPSWTHIVIDCETMLCYHDGDNANQYVTVGNFPTFKAGGTRVQFMNDITKLEVYPRWWRI